MRVKSAIWVAAYVRRCHIAAAYAVVRRRGADDAGAIFVKVDRLDGRVAVYGPAPQTAFDEAEPSEHAFVPLHATDTVAPDEADRLLSREMRFDPDLWIVEIEDRAGRHFLDRVLPR